MKWIQFIRLTLIWTTLMLFCSVVTSTDQITVNMGVILPDEANTQWSLRRVVPAIEFAVDYVQKQQMVPKVNVTFITADSRCSETFAPLAAIDFFMLKKVNVFLGPVCDYAVAPVARFSPHWNVPLLTAGAWVQDFDDKAAYRQLTRVLGAYSNGADFIVDITQTFNWTRLGLLYHDRKGSTKRDCYFRMEALFNIHSRLYPDQTWHAHFDETQSDSSDYDRILRKAGGNARIVVLCASADSVREIMIKAHDLNFDNGEYVFFNIDLFSSKDESKKPWYRKNDTKERNDKAQKAYEALMTVTLRKPTSPEYKNFSKEVKKRAKEQYKNFTYGEEEVNSFVGAFHDAVILYAHALNETLEANLSITDGKEITRRMWNRTFKGITGEVSIDANGDRNADYSLLDMDPKSGEFEVVANYFGNSKLYEPVKNRVIRWAGNRDSPPPDTPKCGFDHSKCPPEDKDGIRKPLRVKFQGSTHRTRCRTQGSISTEYYHTSLCRYGRSEHSSIVGKDISNETEGRVGYGHFTQYECSDRKYLQKPFPKYGIVIIVLGALLVFVLLAAFFVYRHYKLEAELNEMNWRVKWEDIMLGTIDGERKERKKKNAASNLSLARRYSVASSCSGDTIAVHLSDVGQRQLFTKTGYYKGAIVAIKPIQKTSITINKPMLMDVKRIKDLQNDHIVRFIGACLDAPHMCILTEYCQKGSLQDVLENEQIKLDWMFRYSLMQDIVRAMAYLHGSDIKSHGALKSTNCVVDSRFVLKITDFGLHQFRGQDEEHEGSYTYYRSLQWTAPELLRMRNRPPNGTVKGDVYSFGIICQEIVYRAGVFYIANQDFGPEDIVERVKSYIKPPFRPTLEEFVCPRDELAVVIRKCWAEDPFERPDFTQLKSIIRRMNKDGDKGNILDNLLSRMEQYANNLESLVEERTADYLEQKKKAEDLLYLMLPKQVAGQLIRGETVLPESFDGVTIYFSDIVGFTALSAESTPIQIVDLLNDLYTTFDSVIENFDVYKVETIGDAYMVVSGLPGRNGNLHAREIARMSIALLNAVMSFKIRHRPNEQLKVRIGIHSGSVCAGVVGLKMPRYCLFGDTVNTCSRMESNGLPLRIHVSPQTQEILQTFGTFDLELRGAVEMKGKGSVTTYWLLGERTGLGEVCTPAGV